jgi:hemerythrin-like metal-binding protein
MSWYSLFKTGVQEIDAEHEAIDSLIARAHQVGEEKSEYLHKVVGALLDHFRHEEEMCKHMGMPLKRAHVSEHERLTNELLALKTNVSDGSATELLHHIQKLLRDHVGTFDQHITLDEENHASDSLVTEQQLD